MKERFSSLVLRPPGRGPGFVVSALSAAMRVPRSAAGRPPKVKPEEGRRKADLIENAKFTESIQKDPSKKRSGFAMMICAR